MKNSKTLRKKSRKRKSSRRRYNGGAAWGGPSYNPHAENTYGFSQNRFNREERDKALRAATMLRDIDIEANAQLRAKELAKEEVLQSGHRDAAAIAAFYEEYGAPRSGPGSGAGPASDPIPGTAFQLEVRKHTPMYARRRLIPPIDLKTATKEQANEYRAYSLEAQQAFYEDRAANLFPYRYFDQKKYAEKIIQMIVVPVPGEYDKEVMDLFIARLMAFLVT